MNTNKQQVTTNTKKLIARTYISHSYIISDMFKLFPVRYSTEIVHIMHNVHVYACIFCSWCSKQW